ncbi:MAG: glycoside hydrolase [Bacteroidia bacterium]|nr:glycoside hydrolase [Bacteroidia bacterium]
MRESFIQSLRTLAIYLLIGLPILILLAQPWNMKMALFSKGVKPVSNVKLDQKFSGKWKFNILDNPEWKEKDFQDENWEEISAAENWEKQGFEGYNGYAWYRKEVKIDPALRGKTLELYLGRIDDVDEVFVDGALVGQSGQFPPKFITAYNRERTYMLSPEQTKNEKIQIAIRVFDAEYDGGFLSDILGFRTREDAQFMEISLEGMWKFRTTYTRGYPQVEDWVDMYVPSTWESQGIFDYDGYATYKKEFSMSDEQANDSWVLVLGKVDDVDRTYINDILVGSTGDEDAWKGNLNGNEWLKDRAYPIPSGVLQAGNNMLQVKVYDGLEQGGIYEGPVGLIRAEDYTSFWKSSRSKKANVYCNPHKQQTGKHLWCQNQ